MRIKNHYVKAVFRLLYTGYAFYGILLAAVFPGDAGRDALTCFAIANAVACVALTAASFAAETTNVAGYVREAFSAARFFVMQTGLAVLVMYHGMDWPQAENGYTSIYGVLSPSNLTLYTLTPALFWLDWALFCEKGRFHRFAALTGAAVPFIYLLFVAWLPGVPGQTDLHTDAFFGVFYRGIGSAADTVPLLAAAVLSYAAGAALYTADRAAAKRAGKE